MSALDRPLDRFLEALRHAGRDYRGSDQSGRWMGQCPAHDDREPSLSITEGDHGRVLLHCFGGCDTGVILGALDLEWPDLFPDELRNCHRRKKEPPTGFEWAPDPAALLEAVAAFIRHYVVVTEVQGWALALYVLHTHAFEAAECSPYLHIGSPEKRCGKTLLMKVLRLLVRSPWQVVQPSEAVVYRYIEKHTPTLLLDEIDTIFSNRDQEPLRAVFNAGNEAGTVVPRCGGKNRDELQEFNVFCPKVFAGIGNKLPETVRDRSITIAMKRKAPGEKVARWRKREVEQHAEPIRTVLGGWAKPVVEILRTARPDLPDELDDRAADGWEPLLAIADLAGEGWPERARAAAITLSGHGKAGEDSRGVQLLADTKTAFEKLDDVIIPSKVLATFLNELDDSPWGGWSDGKGITQRKVAAVLREFDIHPGTCRIGADVFRGYKREHFEDAWTRYLHSEALQALHPHEERDSGDFQSVTDGALLRNEYSQIPLPEADVADVTVQTGEMGL